MSDCEEHKKGATKGESKEHKNKSKENMAKSHINLFISLMTWARRFPANWLRSADLLLLIYLLLLLRRCSVAAVVARRANIETDLTPKSSNSSSSGTSSGRKYKNRSSRGKNICRVLRATLWWGIFFIRGDKGEAIKYIGCICVTSTASLPQCACVCAHRSALKTRFRFNLKYP